MTDDELKQETRNMIGRQVRAMTATDRIELIHAITDAIVEWMDSEADQLDRDYTLDGILDRLDRVGCNPFVVGRKILDELETKES